VRDVVYRVDTAKIRDDCREEIAAWVKSLGVDPNDVLPSLVIRMGKSTYELHLSRFVRSEQGRIRFDEALERPVSEPLIVDLGTAKSWPRWLGGEGVTPLQSLPSSDSSICRMRVAHVPSIEHSDPVAAEAEAALRGGLIGGAAGGNPA
jgi:hypothetical protein